MTTTPKKAARRNRRVDIIILNETGLKGEPEKAQPVGSRRQRAVLSRQK